ncbi:MAG: hypothetical protein IJO98_04780 [Clostridia bacterium]|nr:hypothetical protein [Clostridia bacterium]
MNAVGCLLIGDTLRMNALRLRLNSGGAATAVPAPGENLYRSVQEGFLAARRPGGACIAAEGEMWAAALSLAAQLSVDRVALFAPTDSRKRTGDKAERQIEWMKAYARRNLSFCVCQVLILEDRPSARLERVWKMLLNARVHRCSLDDQRWTNCEFSHVEAAARYLERGELPFSLAKLL